nr:GNAT family N-acetyltransferase [Lachnoclostridium sp. Marseille-P6806]
MPKRSRAGKLLHPWDEKGARESAEHPKSDVWGAFDEAGRLISAVSTLRHTMTYERAVLSCGELHMVGTLPETRGSGAVRSLMGVILREYKDNGDLFATLIPFSFAFYRKFGFEAASEMVEQKADIQQFSSFKQTFAVNRILSQEAVDEAHALYMNFIRDYNLADTGTDEKWI